MNHHFQAEEHTEKLPSPRSNSLSVIALGGNAILRKSESGTYENQYRAVQRTAVRLCQLIAIGKQIVVTHGNGPQVGATLIRHETAMSIIPPLPLHACGAETQGFLGYIIQQSLHNEMRRQKLPLEVIALVTQVVVDSNDPAFRNPTKPIGPFYTCEESKELLRKRPDLIIKEEPGKGFRRVVPSPDPKKIVETEAIKQLVKDGTIVIASGGGGIPVIKDDTDDLQGIDAVIDKDLSAERLATSIGANELVILTDVEGVYLNYGSRTQKLLRHVTANELRQYTSQGHFASGSMKPKVEAALRFVDNGGQRAIIAELDSLENALQGKTGTHVTGEKKTY